MLGVVETGASFGGKAFPNFPRPGSGASASSSGTVPSLPARAQRRALLLQQQRRSARAATPQPSATRSTPTVDVDAPPRRAEGRQLWTTDRSRHRTHGRPTAPRTPPRSSSGSRPTAQRALPVAGALLYRVTY